MASNLATYFWDFGDGNISFDKTNTHIFSASTYNVLLIVTDNSARNIADTVLGEVYVLSIQLFLYKMLLNV